MDKYTKYFKGDQFADFCGIELITCHPGYAKTRVTIQKHHLNGAGVVHGGLLFTLADFAFAAAVNSYGSVTLSISCSMTYFDKSTEGELFAEAVEISKSNKLIHCDINITNCEKQLLANFKGTAYITKKVIEF